jgi:hypothetical protein
MYAPWKFLGDQGTLLPSRSNAVLIRLRNAARLRATSGCTGVWASQLTQAQVLQQYDSLGVDDRTACDLGEGVRA